MSFQLNSGKCTTWPVSNSLVIVVYVLLFFPTIPTGKNLSRWEWRQLIDDERTLRRLTDARNNEDARYNEEDVAYYNRENRAHCHNFESSA